MCTRSYEKHMYSVQKLTKICPPRCANVKINSHRSAPPWVNYAQFQYEISL